MNSCFCSIFAKIRQDKLTFKELSKCWSEVEEDINKHCEQLQNEFDYFYNQYSCRTAKANFNKLLGKVYQKEISSWLACKDSLAKWLNDRSRGMYLKQAKNSLEMAEKLWQKRIKAKEDILYRNNQRGSILIMTLIIVSILFLLGMTYLSLLARDHRFYGVQERSMQAWYLAQSGQKYWQRYGGLLSSGNLKLSPGNLYKDAFQLSSGDVALAKVCIPEDSQQSYFEILRDPRGRIIINGVFKNTLSTSKGENIVSRTLELDNLKNVTWDSSLEGEL